MRLHYMGKYNMKPEELPGRDHEPGAVAFKEPKDSRTLGLIANGISLVILVLTMGGLILRGGFTAVNIIGVALSLVVLFPHEILHACCFREDVYLYTNLKQGMMFVIGPETMSKGRFIFMSLLPNIVFGFVPYIIFMIRPELTVLGSLGALAIPMGAGDYLNVFNAATQMPRGSRTYLHHFSSYWYMPQKAD